MKIKSIKLSNILSFKFSENLDYATGIEFKNDLNIIIGENGSGKSTILEAINFIFHKVIFKKLHYNDSRNDPRYRKDVANIDNDKNYSEYRLEPNWDTEDMPQHIVIVIEFDDIDKDNVTAIKTNADKILAKSILYSHNRLNLNIDFPYDNLLKIEVSLDKFNNTYLVSYTPDNGGLQGYLENYELISKMIELHNSSCEEIDISPLNAPFTILSAFRNYGSFNSDVSLRDDTPQNQIYNTFQQNYSKSINSVETQEPIIFNIVRLRIAGEHFRLTDTMATDDACIVKANELDFIKKINQRLAIINLKCVLHLTDKRLWLYAFKFIDIKHNRELGDINSLSAGQKSIAHLIFETYGRDNLNGGLVVIDEPEIHLHYQLQHEYLHIINELIGYTNMQYILVTHSGELISSDTIEYVQRLALDDERHSIVYSPSLTTIDKWLIKVLDNSHSTYALFGKAVILTEGECDQYYFRAILKELYPQLAKDIAVFNSGGKLSIQKWRDFFADMGLKVYEIYDLDKIINIIYKGEQEIKLGVDDNLVTFINNHPNLHADIQSMYASKIYILESGTLENYIGLTKKAQLSDLINHCSTTTELKDFLGNETNQKSLELKNIMHIVVKDMVGL